MFYLFNVNIIVCLNSLNKYDSKETRTCKKMCELKRKQLSGLLAKPVFPSRSYTEGKYPIFNSDAGNKMVDDDNDGTSKKKQESAVEVMNTALKEKNTTVLRRRAKPLFKPHVSNNRGSAKNKLFINKSKLQQ